MSEDNVRKVPLESAQQIAAQLARCIRDAQSAIERLAAETGEEQAQTLGILDGNGRLLLQVYLTCEPRQFAKSAIELGEGARVWYGPIDEVR